MLTHITLELLEYQVTQAWDVLRNTKSNIATESGLFKTKIWPEPFLVVTICEAISFLRKTNCRFTDCSDSLTFQAITLEFL